MTKTKTSRKNRTVTNRGALALGEYFRPLNEGAEKVGVGPSQFSLLLSGKRKPSIEVAAKIEDVYGVPCRYWTEEVTIEPKDKDIETSKRK